MTKPQINLSSADARILDTVFDPESAPEAPRIHVDATLPDDPHITNAATLAELRATEHLVVKTIESTPDGTDDAEKQLIYDDVLEKLDGINCRYPKYASAWLNRAVVARWRFNDKLVVLGDANMQLPNVSDGYKTTSMILDYTQRAIDLASPPQGAAVSPSQQRLLAQAWMQKGVMHLAAARDLAQWCAGTNVPTRKAALEEQASRCFFTAGLYGSEIGKAMAVRYNPTAKLCGSIVSEALRREMVGGEEAGS